MSVAAGVGRIWTAAIPFGTGAIREMGGGIMTETETEDGIGIGI